MYLANYQFFITIVAVTVNANFNQDAVDAMTRFSIEATQIDGIWPNPLSTITAILCPNIEEKIVFVKHASKNGILIKINDRFDFEIPGEQDFHLHRNYNLLDVDCPGAFDTLLKANSNGMFVGPSRWLLLQDLRGDTNEKDLLNFFNNLSILPDSDVVIGQRLDNDSVKLISIYKTNPYGKLIVEDRGYWKDGKGFYPNNTKYNQVSSVRRKNLQGTPLNVSILLENPDSINHLTDFKDRHIDSLTKVNYPWVNFLGEMMNATLSFYPVNTWGYRSSNGSWNGLIGMLDRGEAEMTGSALFLTPERIGVVSFLSLETPTRARFIFKRPPLSYVSNIFVLPFETQVWLASGVMLILISGLLHVTLYWEWYMTPEDERNKPDHSGNVIKVSWSDNIVILIGAVFQQGSSFEPHAVSPRIIFIFLLVAFLSLYTSYTANIVALLQSSTTSINSLETLLQSSMKIGSHDNAWSRYYFPRFSDSVRKAIYEKKMVPNGQSPWFSVEEGVKRLRNGPFAYHAECTVVYKTIQETFQEDEKCGLQEIDYLHVLSPTLAIRRQSPYLEINRVNALKIHEVGLRTRQMIRIYTEKPLCHSHTSFISVSLIDSYAAFAFLGWGVIVSLGVLLLEIQWQRKTSASLKQ